MDVNAVLHVAAYAGKLMLESGGETYRVEDIIKRICMLYGASEADSFVTPTGMMVSLTFENQTYSLIKRVTSRTVNLDKIDKINDLSRKITSNRLSVSELNTQLKAIENGERYSFPVTLIFSALGAGSFSVLFGGDLKDVFAAFLIGIVINLITTKFNKLEVNHFFINSIGGGVATLLAFILYKLGIASNINYTTIGAIMLLVPGLAITNAIRDTLAGDLLAGLTRGAEAILVAISIAVGSGAMLSLIISVFGGIY
ncbi:MAG: threonine/serine exporter family protein [Clostridium sp.]